MSVNWDYHDKDDPDCCALGFCEDCFVGEMHRDYLDESWDSVYYSYECDNEECGSTYYYEF